MWPSKGNYEVAAGHTGCATQLHAARIMLMQTTLIDGTPTKRVVGVGAVRIDGVRAVGNRPETIMHRC
jgi:hypothetical protein